jgi:hypothetical protein
MFEIFPQVQEISSVVHLLSCFGGGFSVCLFIEISGLGSYFFAPPPFSGAGSVFHQHPPPLSMYYDGSLFIFNFAGQFDFLCFSLAQGMISVICYLPCFGGWLIIHLPSAFLPLLIVHAEISSLLLSPSPVHFQLSHPLCCCTRLQFSVYCSGFLWGSQSAQGVCLFILGVTGGILRDMWCSLVSSVECLTGRFGASGGSCGGIGSPQVFSA